MFGGGGSGGERSVVAKRRTGTEGRLSRRRGKAALEFVSLKGLFLVDALCVVFFGKTPWCLIFFKYNF